MPRSIAFVGASERLNAPATRGLRHCIRLGFPGPLYAVNPKYEQLLDRPCVPTVAALRSAVDLAVIALPAAASLQALRECQDLGVGAVVLCSSGWGEAGDEGREREAELRVLLSRGRTRVLGPNCIGAGSALAPYSVAYNSSFEHLSFKHRRPIGVVCQSGAMLGGLLLNGEDAGIGVAAYLHVGNGVDITLEAAAAHMLQRPEVATVALLVEGLSDGPGFVALAQQAGALGKQIAVYKAGRSLAGKAAVQSHTGALAGEDTIFSAICEDEGVVRVAEPEDLLPVARMLTRPAASGRRALVFTLSGGGASALADELESQRIAIPPLDPSTISALDALGDPHLRSANPLDVGSSVFSDPALPASALQIALRDPAVDAACWIGVGAPRDERSRGLLASAVAALRDCGKPVVVLPLSGTPSEPGFDIAHEADIPVARSVRAAALLLSSALAPADTASSGASPSQVGGSDSPHTTVIVERQARMLLADAGVAVLPFRVIDREEDLVPTAKQIGYPVVLKGVVADVSHKSEAGLVHLRLTDAGALLSAATQMRARCPQLQSFIVERMLDGGIETVIGARIDAHFGPMLMFGLGGTAVELHAQVAFTQCPCDEQKALRLVQQSNAWPLLRGYRGAPRGDVPALIESMVRLSAFAYAQRDTLLEVEVNPFIVLSEGCGAYAVDALIVQQSPQRQGHKVQA